MQLEMIIALLVVTPIVIFPVALVWYMNLAGMHTAVKERVEKPARQKDD